MADLRVNVVGPPRQDHDPLAVLPGPGHRRLPLPPHLQHVGFIGGKGVVHRLADLLFGDAGKDGVQAGRQLPGQLLLVIDIQEGIQEIRPGQIVHIAAEQLRVVGHHRAVVVVVALPLVHVVGQAGVEDGVHALLQQQLYVAVHDLRRVAGRVRRDGELPFFVDPPAGKPGDLHPEAQTGKKCVPQRQQLIHPQGQRQADHAPDLRPRLEGGQGVPLPGVQVGQLLGGGHAQPLLALVAGDELFLPAEAVDSQAAVVGAALAGGRL